MINLAVVAGMSAIMGFGCKEKVRLFDSEIPKMKTTLELTGAGLGKPATYTFDQLAAMPMVRLDDVLMLKSHDDDEVTSWEGPALDHLLSAAEIKPGPMRVTLEAEDGYQIDVTLEDLEDAIIAMKDGEGRWLARADEDCELKLVPPHKPGNFWVMNLCRIKVEPAENPSP